MGLSAAIKKGIASKIISCSSTQSYAAIPSCDFLRKFLSFNFSWCCTKNSLKRFPDPLHQFKGVYTRRTAHKVNVELLVNMFTRQHCIWHVTHVMLVPLVRDISRYVIDKYNDINKKKGQPLALILFGFGIYFAKSAEHSKNTVNISVGFEFYIQHLQKSESKFASIVHNWDSSRPIKFQPGCSSGWLNHAFIDDQYISTIEKVIYLGNMDSKCHAIYLVFSCLKPALGNNQITMNCLAQFIDIEMNMRCRMYSHWHLVLSW